MWGAIINPLKISKYRGHEKIHRCADTFETGKNLRISQATKRIIIIKLDDRGVVKGKRRKNTINAILSKVIMGD